MEGGAFVTFFMLTLILCLAGVMVYLYLNFRDHKVAVSSDIQTIKSDTAAADKRVSSERVDRLGNIKYVVNQVNDINDTIWKSYQSSNTSNQAKLAELKAANETLIHGVDTFFKFSTDTLTDRRLFEAKTLLTVNDKPKLDIMREVSLVSGITAKDLKPPTTGNGGTVSGVMAKFCGTGVGAPCISFPNADGDSYLTALQSGKNIVLDAPVKIKQGLVFEGSTSEVSSSNGVRFKSNVGIGNIPDTTSLLNLGTDDTRIVNLIKAGLVDITRDGKVVIKNSTGNQATLEVPNTGPNVGKLVITAPAAGIQVTGNVSVNGTMNVSGRSFVGGAEVGVVAAPAPVAVAVAAPVATPPTP